MKATALFFTALMIVSVHQILSGETSGDWTYTVTDNQATITGYSGAGGEVVIPAVVNEMAVVKVGDEAFKNNTSVTGITIPDSVTSIGDGAFLSCYSLADITVDAGNLNYSSVDGVLFNKLQTLLIQYPAGRSDNSYTIPESVTSIGDYAFESCTSLTSVTIGNSVTSIGGQAFYFCTNLTSITIPDSVTSIGGFAFASCTSLTSVTIPDSVTSIGDDAFISCDNLTNVTLPKLLVEDYESFGLSADQVVFDTDGDDAGVTMNIGGRVTLVVPVGWSSTITADDSTKLTSPSG